MPTAIETAQALLDGLAYSEVLASVLEPLPALALPAVDTQLRSRLFARFPGWRDLNPVRVAHRARAPQGWAIGAVAASHPVGFVRQAATLMLGEVRDGRGVPFLVLRLNDWVAEVRRQASVALGSYLTPAFAPALVAALPLVDALERQRRGDHAPIVASILELLRTPACREAVLAGLRSSDREVRRRCLRLGTGGAVDDPGAVLALALSDPDPQIRVWAVRWARPWLERPVEQAAVRRALEDRSVQVRRAALMVLAEALPADLAQPLIEDALTDPATMARRQARLLRLEQGAIDLADFYRRALAAAKTPRQLRGALLGLGESGTRQDVPLAAAHLRSPRPGLRRMALRALANLEPPSVTEPFLAALADKSPASSREGQRALVRRLDQLPLDRLAALLTSGPPHVRRNVLALASGCAKWVALPFLLEGRGDPDPTVSARARGLLASWQARYNRSFAAPSHQKLDQIDQVLRRVAPKLERRERLELEILVRTARGFATR